MLAVEDNEQLRRVLVRQLHEIGYQVLEAEAGGAALDILRGEHKIDLLLTDIVMPGELDGIRLAEEAIRLRPELKVMFTSGFPEPAFNRSANLSADDVLLSKPYRKADLATKVRQVLAA